MAHPNDILTQARAYHKGLQNSTKDRQLATYRLFAPDPKQTTGLTGSWESHITNTIIRYLRQYHHIAQDITNPTVFNKNNFEAMNSDSRPHQSGATALRYNRSMIRLVRVSEDELRRSRDDLAHLLHGVDCEYVTRMPMDRETGRIPIFNEAQTAQQYMRLVLFPSVFAFNKMLTQCRPTKDMKVEPRAQCMSFKMNQGVRVPNGRIDHGLGLFDAKDPTKHAVPAKSVIAFVEEKTYGCLARCNWNKVAMMTKDDTLCLGGLEEIHGDVVRVLRQVLQYADSGVPRCVLTDGPNPVYMTWEYKDPSLDDEDDNSEGAASRSSHDEINAYWECTYWTHGQNNILSEIGMLIALLKEGTEDAVKCKFVS